MGASFRVLVGRRFIRRVCERAVALRAQTSSPGCSPDGAQRNPGLASRDSRIALRSIRATLAERGSILFLSLRAFVSLQKRHLGRRLVVEVNQNLTNALLADNIPST